MACTPLDWVFIAIAAFLALKGVVKGAVREVFSFAALLSACGAAFWYFPLVVPYLQPYVASKWGRLFTACAVIFLAVWIAVNLVGFLVEKLLKLIRLGFLDHAAGLAVGAAKAYLLVCALVVGLLMAPLGREALKDSRLAIYTLPLIARVLPYVPEGLRALTAANLEHVKARLLPGVPADVRALLTAGLPAGTGPPQEGRPPK